MIKENEINVAEFETPEEHTERVLSRIDLAEYISFDAKLKALGVMAQSLSELEKDCLNIYLIGEALEVYKKDYLPFPIMNLLAQFYDALSVAIYPEQNFPIKLLKDEEV